MKKRPVFDNMIDMEEQGTVVQVKEMIAVIKAQRSGSCDSCASKKSCHSGGTSDEATFIEADNSIGAKVGDHVIFAVGAGSVIKAGVLIYLVPILSFIGGVVLGQILSGPFFPETNHDLVAGAFGALFLAIAFVGLKLYNRSLEGSKTMRPKILRVV